MKLRPLLAFVLCTACGPTPAPEGESSPESSSGPMTSGSFGSSSGASSSDDSSSSDTGLDSSGEPAVCMPVLDFETRPTSERIDDGTGLRLLPSGLRLAVPEGWEDGDFHLSADELAMVEGGQGEWSDELAGVANALLDFQTCASHFGRYPWASGGGMWVRAYVVDESPADIEARILAEGLDLAEGVGGINPVIEQERSTAWRRTKLSFDLWFGDYGGEASLDFRMREQATVTTVFLFMYADFTVVPQPDAYVGDIATILDSACLPDAVDDFCCE